MNFIKTLILQILKKLFILGLWESKDDTLINNSFNYTFLN